MRSNLNTSAKSFASRVGGLSQSFALATALCGGFATAGFAQSENTVTLKYEGGEDITGEFIEEANGLVKINSAIGVIVVPMEGLSCVGAFCPEGTHIELVGDPIVLTSKQGDVTLTGHLIEIDDDQYVLATDIGEMKVYIADVNCEGESCVVQEEKDFAFGGNVTLISGTGRLEGVLTDLVDGAYVIDTTNMGMLRVSTDTYTCEGEGCP